MGQDRTLPYNLSPEELEDFLFLVDEMPEDKSEDDLKEKIGSNYSRVKSAAESLGLSESSMGKIRLTELGREYKEMPEEAITDIIADYSPYARFFKNKSEKEITKSEVTEFFMQQIGKGRRASEQATLFLFRLISDSGGAEYIKGHGPTDTRIRLKGDFWTKLDSKLSGKGGYEITISDNHKSKTVEVEDEFDWEVAEAVLESFRRKWKRNRS